MSLARAVEFKKYVGDLLAIPGKKFLLAGETHSPLEYALKEIISALREIQESPSTIILVSELLAQIVKDGTRQAYTIEQLRQCEIPEHQLILFEELIALNVQVYGAENENSDFIHQPKATSKEELYQRLDETHLFPEYFLKELKKKIVDEPSVDLEILELAAATGYAKIVDRIIRGSEVFTECLVQVTYESKDQNTLSIFVVGAQHVAAMFRDEHLIEPGMQTRVKTEYKAISGTSAAHVETCYIANPLLNIKDSYTPISETGETFAAISPVFIATPTPGLQQLKLKLFGKEQKRDEKKEPQKDQSKAKPASQKASCVIL